MNNREAITHALAAIEDRKTITIARQKAKPVKAYGEAGIADADAWNTLHALRKII